MIYSMTGFAVGEREFDSGSVHMELRSVNSRYLDLVFRLGDELRAFEPELRECFAARLRRGKVECRFSLQSTTGLDQTLVLNEALLKELEHVQARVRLRLPDARALSVHEILHWPGMLAEVRTDADALRAVVLELATRVAEDLLAARAREGAKLTQMIRERLARMHELVAQAQPRMPEVVQDYQDRLQQRLREAAATLDEDRLRQEVAIFAQRIDVDEELNRLAAHLIEVERILSEGGVAGKKLDFLMQELNREANTLASKSSATDISAIAMEMKVLIEQMREQVQNIE